MPLTCGEVVGGCFETHWQTMQFLDGGTTVGTT